MFEKFRTLSYNLTCSAIVVFQSLNNHRTISTVIFQTLANTRTANNRDCSTVIFLILTNTRISSFALLVSLPNDRNSPISHLTNTRISIMVIFLTIG